MINTIKIISILNDPAHHNGSSRSLRPTVCCRDTPIQTADGAIHASRQSYGYNITLT